jgi:hypothetical protein
MSALGKSANDGFWPGPEILAIYLIAENQPFIGRTHSLRAYGSSRCVADLWAKNLNSSSGSILLKNSKPDLSKA